MLDGTGLERALDAATDELRGWHGHQECLGALERARTLAAGGIPSAEKLESLGQGWVGEEALAIAVCCSLVASDFRHGVTVAVNHGGDSDSTGAITGNILGVLLGADALPADWLAQLELRNVIEDLAADVALANESSAIPWKRYPGW